MTTVFLFLQYALSLCNVINNRSIFPRSYSYKYTFKCSDALEALTVYDSAHERVVMYNRFDFFLFMPSIVQ